MFDDDLFPFIDPIIEPEKEGLFSFIGRIGSFFERHVIRRNNTGIAQSDDKPKKMPSPPEIDKHLQMKWGLALLGKERSMEYLEWLRKKTGRKPQ